MSRMDPQDARQGRKGTPVLRILIAALALVVVAGIGMSMFGYFMPDQTLQEAETGGGLNSPNTTATPEGGTTTVTPNNNATTGNAPN